MARKSRKNRNVESNIQTVVKKENLLDTAAYIRLSVENGGNETDETLVVQQMLVERFIEEVISLYRWRYSSQNILSP